MDIWTKEKLPELVLIDGRFRVASFLTCLIYGRPGTEIFFDDYVGRQYYHIVEELIRPLATSGRQGYFVIPEDLDKNKALEFLDKFMYVMD